MKGNALKLKTWKSHVADLSKKKSLLYSNLQTLRTEVQEAKAVKKCVEQAIQSTEQKREKTKDRDMML